MENSIEDVWKDGAEEKIWVQEGRGNRELEQTELWGGFMISTTNQNSGVQKRKNKMDGTCGMYVGGVRTGFWGENLRKWDPSEDRSIDGKIILK